MKAPRVLVELPIDLPQDEQDSHKTKREAKDDLRIETAVFVDDDMVTFIKKRYPGQNVKETITDTVFAIMNGVSRAAFYVTLGQVPWEGRPIK